MKIDIHVHTKKVKSGDSEKRNVTSEKFGLVIKNTDVKILAITNHNHFDLAQYEQFREIAGDSCQIWPGVELDILENNKRAHLLVIVNPKNYKEFDIKVSEVIGSASADTFTISLQDTVTNFDHLDCIYIAHYFVKKPNLADEEIELLTSIVSNPKRILKEATNSISAGIYISHGHNSIYGSDNHDWDNYEVQSKYLPELRLRVESFDQFCLLLEKDEATINTILNQKVKEQIEFTLFSAAELIRLDIYNDINIIFGSKGTGKTKILEELSKYFNSKGHKTEVYKSNDVHLNDRYDLGCRGYDVDVSDFGIDECKEEIEFIKNVTEQEITSLAKYHLHFSTQETNKISQKLKIKDIPNEDGTSNSRQLLEINEVLKQFTAFKNYIENNELVTQSINPNLIESLIKALVEIIDELLHETDKKFTNSKKIFLLNNIISVFRTEISKKTNQPPKPLTTGFSAYAINRIKIESTIKKILNNIKQPIAPVKEYVGSLGIKGELYCQTNIIINNGAFSKSEFKTVKSVNKTPQKDFVKMITSIEKHLYQVDLFEKIAQLNEIENIDTINTLSDLLQCNRHFTINDQVYEPSNGESSMILLHKQLVDDKDIYLIDEPEKSLGNDYINDVIVPLLKEKALLGKKVIVATHDANIAVRTLPYNSIYRLHDQNRYYTMTGNPFTNTLKCINSSREELDWKEISMKTLEGGKEAFGERGKIYGN